MMKRAVFLVSLLIATAYGQSSSDLPRYKLLISDDEQAITAINQIAGQGYRVLLPAPIALFELSPTPAAREYKLLRPGANSAKFIEALNAAGASGFRYIPFSPLMEKDPQGTKYEYARAPHGWSGGPSKPADIVKMTAQGYTPVGLMFFSNVIVSPYSELILERPLGTTSADPARPAPAFEIADAMRADNVLKRVNELAAQGHRFLLPTGSQKGGGIAVVMAKCAPGCGGSFDYKYFDAHDPAQVERDLNDMGKQGYRVLPSALVVRPHLLERDAAHPQGYTYRVLFNEKPQVVETDLNAAAAEGWVPIGYVYHFGFPKSAIYLIIEKALASPAT